MLHIRHFDYIIIGNGLAGLQLALKMASDVFFNTKQIALIDSSEKNTNDKTWSFWETEPSQWNDITHKTWQTAAVITTNKQIDLNLQPYTYKTIRSLDFYTDAKTKLKQHHNIHFIIDEVKFVSEKPEIIVVTNNNQYKTSHVFDSRIPDTFFSYENQHKSIIQHFKGFVIKTKTHSFDETKMTMMDYRLKDGNQTTFIYVLPFSKTEALVEFTYFTNTLVAESVYTNYIKTYIKDYLKIDNYTILETETGQIPMSNFCFEKLNTKNITKIGTGGGWVKASTGYAFKHTEKKVSKIIKNIKSNTIPSKNLFKKKYAFYDRIFLNVLNHENHKGEWIFEQFYSKNPVVSMFQFLDEETSFIEELKIVLSLFSWAFIKAFFKEFFLKNHR